VAAGQVARAAPDGYTLLFLVDSTLTINPHLYRNLPYDAARDFAPISIVTRMPNGIIANMNVQANTIQELIAFAKANPGKLSYASPGIGSAPHIGMELFKLMTGTDILHVPYRATTAVMADILGGRVDLVLFGQVAVRGHVEAGKVKMLALASAQRSPLLPQIPTAEESGLPGYVVNSLYEMVAPANTPQAIVDQLARAIKQAATDPRFIAALAPQGMEIVASTPQEMLETTLADSKKWGEVIAATGTTVNR
jgi:tripartite-type tricarboxylate transporter receptor subunit TctC